MLGGWLFRNRGWLPVPLAIVCLLPTPELRPVGVGLFVLGEGVRLWAVGYIGRRSRTVGANVGELVDVGPYARLRNPLYVGNLLIWAGYGTLGWPTVGLVVPLLAAHYALIVRWEEGQLLSQIGPSYADYLQRVPRWWPSGAPRAGEWRLGEALRSERGTFAVLAGMCGAMALRCYLGR